MCVIGCADPITYRVQNSTVSLLTCREYGIMVQMYQCSSYCCTSGVQGNKCCHAIVFEHVMSCVSHRSSVDKEMKIEPLKKPTIA